MPVNLLSCNPNSLVHSTESRNPIRKKTRAKYLTKSNNSNDNSKLHRILTANQLRLANQEKEIQCLKIHMDFLSNENQVLRTQNIRQEKELINIDQKDVNINKLMDQHGAEIRILKTQLRKTKQSLIQQQDLRKESESEINKLRAELLKTKEIISNKNLLEKVDLKKQLDCALESVASTKQLFEVAQNKLKFLEGNYRVEMTNWRRTSKSYAEKCEELQSKINALNIALMEKNKLLEIQNIYSNRFKMVNVNKKPGEAGICVNCSMKRNDRICKTHLSLEETKVKDDQNQNENKKLSQCKIVEDIRNILIEEIKIGKLSFVYEISDCNLERPCFPIRPLKTDVQIDSPYIVQDSTELQKVHKDVTSVNTSPIKLNECHNLQIQNSHENNVESDRKKSEKCGFNNSNVPKLNVKHEPISRDKTDMNLQNKDTNLKYMYPNQDSIISTDEWYDDLETISMLNSTVDTKCKSLKVENMKERSHSFSSKILDNQTPLPNFMYKLPKPVIEDLKDKASLIDKSYANILRRTCADNVNQRNVSFKVPVRKILKCDILN